MFFLSVGQTHIFSKYHLTITSPGMTLYKVAQGIVSSFEQRVMMYTHAASAMTLRILSVVPSKANASGDLLLTVISSGLFRRDGVFTEAQPSALFTIYCQGE